VTLAGRAQRSQRSQHRRSDPAPGRAAPALPVALALAAPRTPVTAPLEHRRWDLPMAQHDANTTNEEAQQARQALQESMDLRDQGHTDD
jgi:hypothetical protein